METTNSTSDHDLLVIIHTKLERALIDLAGQIPRLTNIEDAKLDRTEAYKLLADALGSSKLVHDDHEIRIRSLEKVTSELVTMISTLAVRFATWGTVGMLALGVAEFLVNKYL